MTDKEKQQTAKWIASLGYPFDFAGSQLIPEFLIPYLAQVLVDDPVLGWANIEDAETFIREEGVSGSEWVELK